MFDVVLMSLGLAMPNLSALYWACGVFGGAFMFLTLLGGDSDTDVDVDADIDVDFDADLDVDAGVDADGGGVLDASEALGHAHAGALSLATWFSFRFLVYFTFAFGALGVLLTYLTDLGRLVVLLISLVGGLAAGQGVHQLFRQIRRASGNSAADIGDYIGKVGRVTVDIEYPQKGQVAVHVRSRERYLPALATREGDVFKQGEEVVIASYQGGIARVVSRKEHEFLTNKK